MQRLQAGVGHVGIVLGLRERVTYRELFPMGLTLFDLGAIPELGRLQPKVRAEIWAMLRSLKLPSDALSRAIAPAIESQPSGGEET